MSARGSDWAMLLALALIWGTSLLFIKLSVESIPPVSVAAGRIVLAAVVLVIYLRAKGARLPPLGRDWIWLVALGVTGNALPFVAISWGEQHITSALAGILLSLMPLATLSLAHFYVAGERISGRKALGFGLGFTGIVVLTGVDALEGLDSDAMGVLGQGAVLFAALCYAINAILARRAPALSADVLSAGSLLVAAVIMGPIAFIRDASHWHAATLVSIGSLAWLGAVATALAMLIYFRLIASAGPTFFSYINFMIPLVAVAAGVAVLGEAVSGRAFFALSMVLGGLWLSQRA